jgi:hypothetical protein
MNVSSLILVIGLLTFVGEPRPEDVVSQPPALDQFVIVPLRVHILTSTELDLADCKLRDADITRIVRKLNSIWNQAGIHFGLESIVREQPAQTDRFRLIFELKKNEFELSDFAILLPKPSRVFEGLQVFFFHELPFNGAYLGDDCAIVQERAALNEVKGGIDEPIPRVLGFAFGRALGLQPRREPRTSLLAPGTNGISLDTSEAEQARKVARTIKGTMTIVETRKAAADAQKAGQAQRARKLESWLGEISASPLDVPKRRVGAKAATAKPEAKPECGPAVD